jgi:hypothetical protein
MFQHILDEYRRIDQTRIKELEELLTAWIDNYEAQFGESEYSNECRLIAKGK